MKLGVILVLASFFLLAVNASAEDMITTSDYQEKVLNLLNQYGENFDDCFPELPSDFPDLTYNYTELNDRINEVSERKWYHRAFPSSYFGSEVHEIFFHIKMEMSHYVISVRYYNNLDKQTFTIYSVAFLGTDMDPNGIEFGHTNSIPPGQSEISLKEIDVCKGTPGFMFISFIMAIAIILIGYSRYKK